MPITQRRKKRKAASKVNSRISLIILFAVLIAIFFIEQESGEAVLGTKQGDNRIFVLNQEDFLSGEGIQSTNALLVRLPDYKVLLDLNSNERVYPASITKIMTALVAIENMEDKKAIITLESEIYGPLYAGNASMAGFVPGEAVTAEDLLYGCLLPSGAEASTALAIHIGGSVDKFIDMMNQKALELGMSDTNFINVTGLHDSQHFSTLNDIALMVEYALTNGEFKKIFTTERYTTGTSLQHPSGITLRSTLLTAGDIMPSFPGGIIIGGKTGYTGEAGLCLASLAKKNGREYILITTGAKGTSRGEPHHINDAIKIYGDFILR